MQERQVTIGTETIPLVPTPFLVLATHNPIEHEGTYPLPEAQVDRFMMKVLVGYPNEEEEFVIVERIETDLDPRRVRCLHKPAAIRNCSSSTTRPMSRPNLIQYAVKLVAATRRPEQYGLKGLDRYFAFGASPRATIGLDGSSSTGVPARALLRAAEDVIDIVPSMSAPAGAVL